MSNLKSEYFKKVSDCYSESVTLYTCSWVELCAGVIRNHGLTDSTAKNLVLCTLTKECGAAIAQRAVTDQLSDACDKLRGLSIERARALCKATVQDVVQGGK